MILTEFNFEPIYKPGKNHQDADAMSRYLKCGDMTELPDDIDDEVFFKEIFFSEALENYLQYMRNYLLDGTISNELSENESKKIKSSAKKFVIENGKLFKKKGDGTYRRVIHSANMAKFIIENLHDSVCGGHFGIENTIKKIAMRYWWPNMGIDIAEYIKRCRPCQLRSRIRYVEPMPNMQVWNIFEKWGGDAIGPLPKVQNRQYIILWTDFHSKWTVGQAVANIDAKTVAKVLLDNVILEHGWPKEIITDRGSGFVGKVIEELTERMFIKHRKTTSYHPPSNGLAERTNKTFIDVLACLILEYEKNWVDMFKWAKWAYNTTTRRSTKHTPYYLKYGREALLPIDITINSKLSSNLSEADIIIERFNQLKKLQDARVNVLETLQFGINERRINRLIHGKFRPVPLRENDLVLVYDSRLDKMWSGKLEARWHGPWKILKVFDNGTYNIAKLDGTSWRENPVSGFRLKKYYS